MAYNYYIYHGSEWYLPSDANTGHGAVTIRNGEILMYEAHQSNAKAKFLMWDGEWAYLEVLIQNEQSALNRDSRYYMFANGEQSPGWIQHIESFNCDQYGLCAYGGSRYTNVRTDVQLWRQGNLYNRTIPAGSDLAIGSGQGYTYGNNQEFIRIYGYWEPNGTWHETYDMYAYVHCDRAVQNTTINTF